MKKEYVSHSLEDTKKIAFNFARNLKGGEIILLNGDLGAGKTTFVKFLAKRLGVRDIVTSPTFTILKQYQGEKFSINHFDMYRLNDYQEAYEFGFEDFINGNAHEITLIEWSERIIELLSKNCIVINISIIDENSRKIVVDE